eukprot:1138198-Pelagomonas_calceolata.AAC.4
MRGIRKFTYGCNRFLPSTYLIQGSLNIPHPGTAATPAGGSSPPLLSTAWRTVPWGRAACKGRERQQDEGACAQSALLTLGKRLHIWAGLARTTGQAKRQA